MISDYKEGQLRSLDHACDDITRLLSTVFYAGSYNRRVIDEDKFDEALAHLISNLNEVYKNPGEPKEIDVGEEKE